MRPRVILLGALALASFGFGVFHQSRTGQAAIPVACPKYECVMVEAWWNGAGAATITASFAPGTLVPMPFSHSDLFATGSGWKGPEGLSGLNADLPDFPLCTPHCGKDLVGNWQAPQQVTRAGPWPVLIPRIQHLHCPQQLDKDTQGNYLPAPQSEDQSNQENPGTPPGVMTVDVPGRSP
jgi:hypothetical protein